jgi:hypothetical protein
VVTQKISHSYVGAPQAAAQAGPGVTAPGVAAPPDAPEA